MVNDIIDSRYQIIAKIGTGSTSVVYKAKRMSDGVTVAIKIMKEEFIDNDEYSERFLSESQALSKLSHPNIRNVLDLGQTDGAYYIVTEYVDGETLKDIIKNGEILPLPKVIDYALQMTAGLAHAHENNIIHRDIKPQNMLVSVDGTLKVADFGIARVLSEHTLTMAGKDVVGSVHYISPEQARGSHIDARSDIYSIGVVLFEMATGEMPFSGTEPVTIAMKHINQLPRKPIEINSAIPQGLNDIILKCMAKDPNNRYQNVEELREDLMLLAASPQNFIVNDSVSTGFERKNDRIQLSEEKTQEQEEQDAQEAQDEINDEKPSRMKRVEAKTAKKARTRKQLILIGVIIAAFAVVAVMLVVFFSPKTTPPINGKVLVPDVVGLSESDAQKMLKSNSLRIGDSFSDFSLTIPAGSVISEDPPAQQEVNVRDVVRLTISKGKKPCTVPLLLNYNLDQATQALKNAGLVLGTVNYENTNDNPADKVFKQAFDSNTLQPEGTAVDIWIAKPIILQKRIVPDLTGLTKEQAMEIIKSKGFLVGAVYEEYTMYPLGVYQQDPVANTEYSIDQNISIKIWVSKGVENLYTGTLTFEIPTYIPDGSQLSIIYVDLSGNRTQVYPRDGTETVTSATKPIEYTYTSNTLNEQRAYYLNINGQDVYSKVLICDKPVVQTTPTVSIAPTPTSGG